MLLSPVLVLCTDEADRYLGARVQFLEVAADNTRPLTEFFQIRLLADASAKGIAGTIVNMFTSTSTRPEELKDLVMSRRHFAMRLSGFVGDGASVKA